MSEERINDIYKEVEKTFGKRYIDFLSVKYMHKTGLSVPFSVFPISPNNLAEILLEGVMFISFISLDSVEKHIFDKGWKFVNTIKETAEKDLFTSPIYIAVDKNNVDRLFNGLWLELY